jgi:hypothetical protein
MNLTLSAGVFGLSYLWGTKRITQECWAAVSWGKESWEHGHKLVQKGKDSGIDLDSISGSSIYQFGSNVTGNQRGREGERKTTVISEISGDGRNKKINSTTTTSTSGFQRSNTLPVRTPDRFGTSSSFGNVME